VELKAELDRRYARVRAAMAEHSLDALVVSGSEYSGFEGSVTYLSGFQIVHRYAYVVVPADGAPQIVFPVEARYVGEHGTAQLEQVFADLPGQHIADTVLMTKSVSFSDDDSMLEQNILDSLSVIPEGFPVLSRLQAKYGVFATLGNHDFYAGADEVAAALRRMTNFTVLRDDFATVHINGAALHIAGVDDMGRDWARGVTFHPGLAKILPRLSPDVPVVLLSHRPDLFPHAVAAGIELVLSGHTHGGQLSLPSLGRRPISIARFITRYDRGLYREASSYVYVNRGLGCTGQRVRLFTPRDISIVEIEVPGERV